MTPLDIFVETLALDLNVEGPPCDVVADGLADVDVATVAELDIGMSVGCDEEMDVDVEEDDDATTGAVSTEIMKLSTVI